MWLLDGLGSVSGAGGSPGASIVAVGAVLLLLLSLVSGCSLMFLFGCTQGCWVPCVLLCFQRPRWVFLVIAGCLGPCSCAPVLVLLVRARGPALRLGVCFLEFPAVVCAVTPIQRDCILRLFATHKEICVTKRRSSWACIGNPNPEQETSRMVT